MNINKRKIKKLLSLSFMSIALMLTLGSCSQVEVYDIPEADEGSLFLTWEGKSNYVIVRGKNASAAEITAAKELQRYLKKISGCKLRILIDEEVKSTETEIIVGKTNREGTEYTIARDEIGDEGFEIKIVNKKLIIAGGELRGTLYGVYDFLEILGCRFFTPDLEVIPSNKTITLDLSLSIKEKPIFEYRDVFWMCAFDEQWSVKQRLNGCVMSRRGSGREISEEYGGGISYAGPYFVHTFEYVISEEKYFSEHPEYFSEIKGERTGKPGYSQLCLTNPDVLEIFIKEVRSWLEKNPNASIISVSQKDAGVIASYCTCDKCKAIDYEERSHAGTLIRFVNAIADSIKEDYPNVAIDTLAYQYSTTPPKKTKPRDNVIIRLCIGNCTAHGLTECTNNSSIKNNLLKWSEICEKIYIWDYTTNFSHYLCPFPNFNAIAKNIKFFAENNVKGVFLQGNYQEGLNGEFGELRSYVAAKLLWDPNANADEIANEFIEAYYKDAASEIKEYINYMQEVIDNNNKHPNWGSNPSKLYDDIISDDDLQRLDEIWSSAKNKARNDPDTLSRIERSELQHRYYKMLSKRGEFSEALKYDELTKEFYIDCKRLGVSRLSEFKFVPDVD